MSIFSFQFIGINIYFFLAFLVICIQVKLEIYFCYFFFSEIYVLFVMFFYRLRTTTPAGKTVFALENQSDRLRLMYVVNVVLRSMAHVTDQNHGTRPVA